MGRPHNAVGAGVFGDAASSGRRWDSYFLCCKKNKKGKKGKKEKTLSFGQALEKF